MLSAVFLLFVSLFTISDDTSDLVLDKDEDLTNCMHSMHTQVWNIVTSTFVEKAREYLLPLNGFIICVWCGKEHSAVESCEALKLAQPDLESLVMEHHLKDRRAASFAVPLRQRWC